MSQSELLEVQKKITDRSKELENQSLNVQLPKEYRKELSNLMRRFDGLNKNRTVECAITTSTCCSIFLCDSDSFEITDIDMTELNSDHIRQSANYQKIQKRLDIFTKDAQTLSKKMGKQTNWLWDNLFEKGIDYACDENIQQELNIEWI